MIIAALTIALLQDVHFELPASGYVFDAATGGAVSDATTNETRFLFRGHAKATSSQMEFRAETVKGLLVSAKGAKKAVLKHADTLGAATVIRRVQAETTTIKGSRFVFDGDAKQGHLQVSGPVDLVDGGTGKSNLHMTGNNGSVDLDMSQAKAQNAFQKARMEGAVAVDIIGMKGDSKVHATGDHLLYDNTSSPPSILMTGNVSIKGQGSNFIGSAPNVDRVKFLLNRQGQWTSLSLNVGEDVR